MTFEREIERVYQGALSELTAIQMSADSTTAERESATTAIETLHRTFGAAHIKQLEQRAVELNRLIATLNDLASNSATRRRADSYQMLSEIASTARRLLVRASREAFPAEADHAPPEDDPDSIGIDTAGEGLERGGAADDTLPVDTPRPQSGVFVTTPPDGTNRMDEYRRMFDSCVVRPDRISTVNWYVEKLLDGVDRYRGVGDPLGIPWWFIGCIHALESGFRFDRHLHNGDPLSARTKHVPAGRPSAGQPPFSWESSAEDALRLKRLDAWRDWSPPGALFKWEEYNGFGYRQHGVPSPYLWSFSNHYTRGRYVADHRFDADAVSKQCGAGVILRSLVNSGMVRPE